MKKIVLLLLALLMILSLNACGKPNMDYSNLYGTWKVSYIESDGTEFSVEEWEELEGDNYSKNAIVIKSGGKAIVVNEIFSSEKEWVGVGDTIIIDRDEYSIVDGVLKLEDWGDYICYKKTSDNQTVPKSKDDEDYEDDEEVTVDKTESNVGQSSEQWKEFLREYEEWVDKYIIVLKKQKANPSDLSILADYTSLVAELAEWSEKADEIGDSIVDVEDAAEYSAEVIRIAAKIAKATEEL